MSQASARVWKGSMTPPPKRGEGPLLSVHQEVPFLEARRPPSGRVICQVGSSRSKQLSAVLYGAETAVGAPALSRLDARGLPKQPQGRAAQEGWVWGGRLPGRAPIVSRTSCVPQLPSSSKAQPALLRHGRCQKRLPWRGKESPPGQGHVRKVGLAADPTDPHPWSNSQVRRSPTGIASQLSLKSCRGPGQITRLMVSPGY